VNKNWWRTASGTRSNLYVRGPFGLCPPLYTVAQRRNKNYVGLHNITNVSISSWYEIVCHMKETLLAGALNTQETIRPSDQVSSSVSWSSNSTRLCWMQQVKSLCTDSRVLPVEYCIVGIAQTAQCFQSNTVLWA